MGEDAELVLCDAAETGLVQKSGNLWLGFQVSYGDYILLLDTDFTRRHDR